MEPDGPGDDPETLHSKVLRATLSGIASRPTAAGPASPGAPESDAADCCVICLDVVSEPCEARPCGHRHFDFLCLVSWLNHRPSCPLCKTEVSQVCYQFEDASSDASSPPYTTYNVPRGSTTKTEPARRPARQSFRHGSFNGHWASGPRSRASARRRTTRPSAPATTAREAEDDPALERRRRVYRLKLFSLHVGTNRITRYTDLTPRMFESDPELISRARMWIRRELSVFGFLCTQNAETPGSGSAGGSSTGNVERSSRQLSNNAEFLLEYIVAILRTVDINGSRGQAEEMLQEFLGPEHTRLFLHELRSWLRSPYTTLENWDAHVQYDETKSTPAATIRRSAIDDLGRSEENDQRPRLTAYPDHYSGHSAARLHGSQRSSRERWSPYSTHTSTRGGAAGASRRTT